MSIQIQKYYVVLHSSTGQSVEPEYMGWQPEHIEEYLKDHPMPQDENYSKEDMINDLTNTSKEDMINDLTNTTGALTLSLDLKQETIDYLYDLMNWLTYDCIKHREVTAEQEQVTGGCL